MTDDQHRTDPAVVVPPVQPQQEPDHAPSAETQNTVEHMIPKSRFDEVNSKAKAEAERAAQLQADLDQIKADQVKAEQDRLKKQGEFETLYTQEQAKAVDLEARLKTATERLSQFEAAFKVQLDARIAALPDFIKPLIEPMDVFAAVDYLDKHADLLTVTDPSHPRKQTPPPFNAADGVQRGAGERTITLSKRVRL